MIITPARTIVMISIYSRKNYGKAKNEEREEKDEKGKEMDVIDSGRRDGFIVSGLRRNG